MPNCRFCRQPVTAGVVHHPECWKKKTEEVAQIFCDEYCRFPREVKDEDELDEHCDRCHLVALLNLGL